MFHTEKIHSNQKRIYYLFIAPNNIGLYSSNEKEIFRRRRRREERRKESLEFDVSAHTERISFSEKGERREEDEEEKNAKCERTNK